MNKKVLPLINVLFSYLALILFRTNECSHPCFSPVKPVWHQYQFHLFSFFVRLDLIFANGMQWYFPLLASLQLLLNNSALILVLDAGFGSDPLNIVKMSHLPRCADTSTFRGFKTVNTDTAWLIINISTSLCVRVGLHKCTP